jgi:hypothetical protein
MDFKGTVSNNWCLDGVATLRSCTQCKRYRKCMLLNVAAQNVRVPKRKVFKT